MPHSRVRVPVHASAEAAFALLHDYSRRLQWDTLLQSAELVEGWTIAQQQAVSLCRGRWMVGGVAVQAEYITFRPPFVAAVRMVNRPFPFERFTASIRHCDAGDGTSFVE